MLRDYQTKLLNDIYQAWADGARNVLAVAPTGAGKCLGRDTPVMMYDGSIKMVQDIVQFDLLMGPDSQPRFVKSVCSGQGLLYKVIPTKGDSYIVNDAHILSLKRTRESKNGGKGFVVNMNVEKFMLSNQWTRHVCKGWRTGVNFHNTSKLPIDPYFLGIWLAEGSLCGQSITTPEPEIKEFLFNFAKTHGYGVNVTQGNNCETINIHNYRSRSVGPLHTLRTLAVINDKHIPHTYKTASRESRLSLLAGYLDGDGHLNNGIYDAICNTSRLANDVAFLARSLGFACYIKKCVKGIRSTGFISDYWRLSISGELSKIPCIVPRRKAEPRNQLKDVLVTGLKIEPVGMGEYFGFELIGNDRLFLLGDFTVTHNTKIKAKLFADYRQPSVAMAHRQELVGQISVALAEAGVIHRIVAPDTVRSFCITKHVELLGRSFHHAQSPIAVGGIDTVNARAETLTQWINTVRLWDIDECFPAGTAVTMWDGSKKPVEQIRPGDSVMSFDDNSDCFVKRSVVRTMCNPQPRTMLDIVINGRHVRCTSGHPFWTRRGWVDAKDLRVSDDLRIYMHAVRNEISIDQRASNVSIEKDGARVLHETVWNDLSRRDARTKATGGCAAESEVLHSVLGASRPTRQDMQSRMSSGRVVPYNVADESSARFDTDDRSQPHAQRRVTAENGRNIACDRASAECEGRQWSGAFTGRTHVDYDPDTARVRASVADKDKSATRDRLSELLQTGHCAPCADDSDRSGRRVTCKSETTGSEEREISYWSRVESISVYEPRDHGFVYNFEVEGTHTYIANDVVTHNCHHVLDANKWGKGVKLFTHAYGVGFTATPGRPDRRGLGRHASGVFDVMVRGPEMRPLINMGYLADYRIFVPPASYVMAEDDVSEATGDYKPERLRAKSHASTITGDIVSHYLKIAPGKRGITFCVDVETAGEVAQAFNSQGVPAAAVSAKTPDAIRDKLITKFRRSELLQLVNCDIFGEGFDVPGVEVVSDGRGTKSFPRFAQAFGRMVRPSPGKTHGIYIDHVSNVKVHGLPDKPRHWTLDDERGKKKMTDAGEGIRVCTNCFTPYEPFLAKCPYCGFKPTPADRSGPQFVDGDLLELDPLVLAKMRGEIERIDSHGPAIPRELLGTAAELRLRRLWGERMDAQRILREVLAYWAGMNRTLHGWSDNELYRRFYHEFGLDVLTAQKLERHQTEQLVMKIRESWI